MTRPTTPRTGAPLVELHSYNPAQQSLPIVDPGSYDTLPAPRVEMLAPARTLGFIELGR